MNEEIERLIFDLEGCCGMFDYMLTPLENSLLVSYIKDLQQENQQLKEIENKLIFIKNRAKQGMSQENINKCAIELVNSYLKGSENNE